MCPAAANAASLGQKIGPRVLRSSLAGPEHRPARWMDASMSPMRRSVGLLSSQCSCVSAVVLGILLANQDTELTQTGSQREESGESQFLGSL